jgi:hypothetical protein
MPDHKTILVEPYINIKSSHSVQLILERLKEALNFQKDVELADFLGVAQNTISAWRKRDSMNYDLLFSKCLPYNIDLNWLIYGEMMPNEIKKNPTFLLQSVGIDGDDEREDFTEEEKAVTIVEMIRRLPWPVPTRRIIMENYIKLVYREVKGSESRHKQH